MAEGKLIFLRPADGTGRLVFGDDAGGVVVPSVEVTVDADFAGDMGATVQLLWDANVSRGERAEARTRWESAEAVGTRTATTWQPSAPVSSRTADGAEAGARTLAAIAVVWQSSERFNSRIGAGWQDGTAQREALKTLWQEASRLRGSNTLRWQDGTAEREALHAAWQEAVRLRNLAATKWQDGESRQHRVRHRSAGGHPIRRTAATRWQDARRPPAGLSVVLPPLPPVVEPCYDPATLGRLEFTEPWANNGRLVFTCLDVSTPGASIVIPVLRTYIVINNATLRRVSDNAVVPCFTLSLTLDENSWTWGFDATAPLEAQGMLLETEHVELSAVVNGTEVRLVVDSVERERVFGQVGLRVAGRGRNALLDSAQFTFGNTAARTAQQLMLDVLTINGVPLGWAVDWQMDDWLVPAGVFAHTGTYQSALTAIAAAAGGFIRPHNSAMSLSVIHRYPDAPWDWAAATPAFEIPSAVATREGMRWVSKPEYTRVYVMGEGQGINGRITRAGTAGTLLAPPVVDPLITATAAARQRGLSILADAGRQKELSLRMPVLPETGIILPGTLLRYVDGGETHLGMVRGVNVDVQMPVVYQTLEVESHE